MVDGTVCATAVFQSLAVGLCLYIEKLCCTSVIVQNRVLTLMSKLISSYLFCRGF